MTLPELVYLIWMCGAGFTFGFTHALGNRLIESILYTAVWPFYWFDVAMYGL